MPIHLLIKARDVTAREWATGEVAPKPEKPAQVARNLKGKVFGKRGQ